MILLVLKLALRVINYVRLSQETLRDNSGPQQVNKMVKDPVCGVYVAVSEAVSLATKQGDVHFCSKQCRDKFLSGQK